MNKSPIAFLAAAALVFATAATAAPKGDKGQHKGSDAQELNSNKQSAEGSTRGAERVEQRQEYREETPSRGDEARQDKGGNAGENPKRKGGR